MIFLTGFFIAFGGLLLAIIMEWGGVYSHDKPRKTDVFPVGLFYVGLFVMGVSISKLLLRVMP